MELKKKKFLINALEARDDYNKHLLLNGKITKEQYNKRFNELKKQYKKLGDDENE